ncbi:argininosuccinate synthase [Parvibacter caecicola]|uniref:Argininosuccinate synthase n=1 Tax=Parvibacter caecicola TaxID=747645 RepID=A0A3N0ACW2_9ACTN|nr:argininosuccinate synthase [Parvibacter caecicola]MBB3170224.1 argininosuccinate synthase [Parvibacter caecicola]MCR2041808.1 argininosuccinate synthase [Parvibacter caecicola]RNL11253.1 argininosuccinate synthase [Parvibacter caecicola]TJW11518.1 argininosuccinate synthase [Parvibacter caecicola]
METQNTPKEKVVLAYSGGLDTSVCITWLQDKYNLDVIAVVGEVGQDHEGLELVKQRALSTGAIACHVVDMREAFAEEYLSSALAANAMYENKYPLVSALSRPLICKHLVQIAHQYGAKYIAHGCTGKGNDQVRFESSITMLDPTLQIIAPVRDWDLKSREEEMEWAAAHGITVPTTNASPYSIDDNLWGRAIECGVLEDPWAEPPADIYTMTVDPMQAPDVPTYVDIQFEAGLPVGLNSKPMSYLDIVYAMNDIAGSNGYGRIDMIENRLVGVKSRECYEAPGALALIMAHKALEDLCLERSVLHYKLGIEQSWAECVYNGLWFSPLKDAFDAFLASTQQCVTGTVKLKLYKGSCTVVGRKSDFSLYTYELATYAADDQFDHQAAKGFIDLHALPCKVWAENRLAMGVRMDSFATVDATNQHLGEGLVEEAEEIVAQAQSQLV